MASKKKLRKNAKHRQPKKPGTGAFRHPDGDRRHRETMTMAIKEAKARKRMMQQPPPLEE